MIKKSWRLGAAIIVLVAFCIFDYVFGLNEIAKYVVFGFAAVISILILIDMIRTLRDGRYGIDILALTAIIATIIVGEYLACLLIILMLTGGEFLEDYASGRAKRELTKLLARAPKFAHVADKKGVLNDIVIEKVRIGDEILVKTGEMLPLDGNLISGNAILDTASITGEPLPRNYKKGDIVLSGSVNQEDSISILVSSDYQNSQYGQIVRLVQEMESKPSNFVRLADRYAVPFTIMAYAIGVFGWVLSGDFMRFAEVVVVASPCPLILAAPVALISGMSRSSKAGVIVKSGTYLEQLASLKSVALDKTGTLSEGRIIVDTVESFNPKYSDKKILGIVAGAEEKSSHIIARSIVEYAKEQNVKLILPETIREHIGLGVDFSHDGKKMIVGNINHMVKHRISVKNIRDRSSIGVFLAIDGKIVGRIGFRDELRKEAKSVIRKIKQFDVRQIAMVTGDSTKNAEAIADELGIKEYYAECLPIDKVDVIETKMARPNVFVGDGVNDAPVMAVADVGIALAAYGSTAASDAADVVVMADDLRKVPQVIDISRRTMLVAKQSVFGGMALCIVLMVLAGFGFIPVVVGALLQEVMDAISILNALRAIK